MDSGKLEVMRRSVGPWFVIKDFQSVWNFNVTLIWKFIRACCLRIHKKIILDMSAGYLSLKETTVI